MQVGRLGRLLRPPSWTSYRIKWRYLVWSIPPTMVGAVIIMIASGGVAYHHQHHRRLLSSQAAVPQPAVGSAVGNGSTSAGIPQAGVAADDHPNPEVMASPSPQPNHIARSKPRRILVQLKSSQKHRQTMASQSAPANSGVPAIDAWAQYCAVHTHARDVGCPLQGARRMAGASPWAFEDDFRR
jgi:hypothetical protein